MFQWALQLIMDSKPDSNATGLYRAHRRKFFSNIAKWFYSDTAFERTPKLDIVDLCTILQSLGFKLQRFEAISNVKSEDLRVEISCGVSNFNAILTAPVVCNCPAQQNGDSGAFWEVTGSEPTNLKGSASNVINEAGCSLLPPIPKGTSYVVRDVITCLLDIVTNPSDVNQNTDDLPNFPSFTAVNNYLNVDTQHRRHSLDSVTRVNISSDLRAAIAQKHQTKKEIPKEMISSTPPKLIREKTWDLEPRSVTPSKSPLPNIIQTSPIPHTCISPNTDLTFPLREARRNIDKVLRMINAKTPPSSKKIPVLKPSPPQNRLHPRNITHSFTATKNDSDRIARYTQARLGMLSPNFVRPSTAPVAKGLRTPTMLRKESPDLRLSGASSPSSLGSTGNLHTVEIQKPMRNSFGGYLPKSKNVAPVRKLKSPQIVHKPFK